MKYSSHILRRTALMLALVLGSGLVAAKSVPGDGAIPVVALMKQVAEAEVEHFKGRERCVEALRKIMSAEQFTQISQLYLDGLR